MIGQSILHYSIIEKLGEGGMGVVYKAQDTKLDRVVALKFLPPHMSASEGDKARFMQEARAAAALNHPNVCSVMDVAEHDGKMFIVMEYVDGQTLRERKDAVSFKQAVDIGIQIADGLAAAHEKGIVHRDIKPENIMIRKDGIAQIMDFGLAKLRSSGSKITRLTKEGSTVGTAGYMSPEQVQGQDVDHRSDIFSFGVLLFELFAGQLPFKGVHETALAYEIVNVDAPPPSSIKPEIDPSLDAIILECLEKDPNERTQSAKQISIDLKRFRRESSRTRASRITAARPAIRQDAAPGRAAAPPAPAWKRLLWPAVAVLALIALGAVLWSPWKASPPARTPVRVMIGLPSDQALVTTAYNPLAISPDGREMIYKANAKFYLRPLDAFTSTPLAGTEEGSNPFYSPDGKWFGYFQSNKLRKVPVGGGAPIDLGDATDNRGGSWGINGDIVFTPAAISGLLYIPPGGGEARVLTTPDSSKGERTHRWPSFLSDGKNVVYTVGAMDSPDYYGDAVIEVVNVATGAKKILLKGGSSPRYIEAGYLVYWSSSSLFAVPFDLDKLEVTGTPFPVVKDVNGDPTTGMAGYAVSSTGEIAYVPGNAGINNGRLMKMDLHGVKTPFPAPAQGYMEPRISPDGTRIALSITTGKDYDIWVYDIQQNNLTKLTFGGVNRTPAWSPDSKRVAYYSYDSAKQRVNERSADGSGLPEVLTEGFGRSYIDDYARDGSCLLFDVASLTRSKNALQIGSDIFVLWRGGARTMQPFLESKFDEWQASLSPDGKWIAYVSNESGVYQVYVQPFPAGAGRWSVSSEEAYNPKWAPDGKTLYYYSPGKIVAVPVQTAPSFAAGKPETILTGYQQKPVDSGLMYDLSPDGTWFVIAQSNDDDDQNLRQIRLVFNWFDDVQAKAK